jgi:hypothetical protein
MFAHEAPHDENELTRTRRSLYARLCRGSSEVGTPISPGMGGQVSASFETCPCWADYADQQVRQTVVVCCRYSSVVRTGRPILPFFLNVGFPECRDHREDHNAIPPSERWSPKEEGEDRRGEESIPRQESQQETTQLHCPICEDVAQVLQHEEGVHLVNNVMQIVTAHGFPLRSHFAVLATRNGLSGMALRPGLTWIQNVRCSLDFASWVNKSCTLQRVKNCRY